MARRFTPCFVCGVFATSLLAITVTKGGELAPPAGPVAPTMKTLEDVEPRIAINATNTPGDDDSIYRITQPGSYYLSGNIVGESGKSGIEIATSGVTIDLMGFDLVGVPGSLHGITPDFFNFTSIRIHNGSVRSWGGNGVDLGSFVATNSAVDSIRAALNGGIGIFAGSGCIVTDCTSYQNSSHGISTDQGAVVTNCVAYNNGGIGFAINGGSTIIGCTSRVNGSHGISVGQGCTVSHCTSRHNTNDGIRCLSYCHIINNTCITNGLGGAGDGAGIRVMNNRCRIEGNHCGEADRGIEVDGVRNLIIRNTCTENVIDWNIGAQNLSGPIIDLTGVISIAVFGNSGPDNTGTTHPNANFTY